MDYLRGFKSVLGGQGEATDGPSGAETIERLVNRVSSATLLEDRRDAVRAIKSLSKKFRLEVGTTAMSILIATLEKDRTDPETCGLVLDALVNIMSDDEIENPQEKDLAVQFTEIFLKDAENVSTLLALLEEYDFRVRWPVVKLLNVLLNNRALQIQQCVLVSPRGVSRLMDLLSDSREVIRNDGLLLLTHLTKGNAAIQKIVAFENAFDRLLEVIAEEGFSDGGIVVEDCLLLMSNLFNESNINFFREGSYIQRLVPFFDFSEYTATGRAWTEPKVKNVLLMLKLVRLLVSPNNPPQSTVSSQKILHTCNLLKILCDILMTVGIPADVLTETVNTVGEAIRGNQTNQAFFSVVDAPYNPPKPAIVVLLMSMISDKQPFPLRCAVLYCFQCYLYKNPTGQSRIISTLLPSSAEASNVTAGQLLCGGLFSPDPFSNWCAAIALSHALIGNKELKEQLLRVQLATGVSNQPVSLLQQCSNILCNGGSTVQTKAAVLSLLCNWLSNCPVVVAHFLSNGAIIPFIRQLIASVEQSCETHEKVIQGLSAILIGVCTVYNNNDVETFTVDAIKRLITTRLDPEHFLAKINDVSKTEPFTNAAKHTQITETNVENVLFDHEFTKQFKKLEVNINKAIIDDDDENESSDRSNESNDAVITHYKDLIREQDDKYQTLSASYNELETTYKDSLREMERQAIELVQLRNQVGLMKDLTPNSTQTEYLQSQVSTLQETLKHREAEIQNLRNELNTKSLSATILNGDRSPNEEGSKLESGYNSHDGESPSAMLADNEQLRKRIETLQEENTNLTKDLETTRSNLTITQASLEVITTNKNLEDHDSNKLSNEQLVELEDLRIRVTSLQQQNETLQQQQQQQQQSSPSPANGELVFKLQSELALKAQEYTQQKQDYEDLLVLLEDQDLKIKKFKTRLRELGEVVVDDETDEDDDEEDVEDIK